MSFASGDWVQKGVHIKAYATSARHPPATAGGTSGGSQHEVGGSAGRAGGECEATPGAFARRCIGFGVPADPPRARRAALGLLRQGVTGKRIADGTPQSS